LGGDDNLAVLRLNGRVLFVSSDASRYDTSLKRDAIEARHQVYSEHLSCPSEVLSSYESIIDTEGKTANGARYTIEGQTKSGSTDTTDGNSINNAIGNEFIFDSVVRAASFTPLTLSETREMIVTLGKTLGWILKVSITDNPHLVEFYSQLFYPCVLTAPLSDVAPGPTYVLAQKPGRQAAKLNFMIGPRTRNDTALSRGIALSHLPHGEIVPGLRQYLQLMVAQNAKPLGGQHYSYMRKDTADEYARLPGLFVRDDRTDEMVLQRYGVSYDELETLALTNRTLFSQHCQCCE
jgi:hypothetical protein